MSGHRKWSEIQHKRDNMAMKKYTQAEGELEVLRGLEAQTLNDHFAKTGKRAVSDFSDEERNALDIDLLEARRQESAMNNESGQNGD